jgi:hypothetical protein
MRWVAAWTVVVLLMCTVITCTGLAAELGHARLTQAPPCHQHQQPDQKPAPPHATGSCDHQQAVTTDNMAMPAIGATWLPSDNIAWPLATVSHVPRLQVDFNGPPGPALASSVLRV